MRILRFCVAGFLAVGTFFVVYLILTRLLGLWHIIAVVPAFLIQVAVNFIVQKHWVFKSDDRQVAKQFFNFMILHLTNFALNTVTLYVMVDIFGFYNLYVQIVSTSFLSLISFLRSRVIFKH